jgi:hypothetical protein
MWKKALVYGAILIGGYLAVDHVAGTAGLLGGGQSLVTNTITSLQGNTPAGAKKAAGN